jgi:hypothetical protein
VKRAVLILVVFTACALQWRSATGGAVPPEVKSVVAFVFVPDKEPGKFLPWGTAFFVAVKDELDPSRTFVYLVTAKHVLRAQDHKTWFPQVFVRLNTRTGGSELIPVPVILAEAHQTVFLHPSDPAADVAVIPALPDETRFDFKALGPELVTSKKDFAQLKIGEGSEVFFTGLFSPYVGTRRNYPVVRFGRVALVTDERVKFGESDADLYLVETGSFGGNSGSPVFFYLGADREPGSIILGPPVLKLVGVMMGTFLDLQPIVAVDTARTAISQSNMGIAAVVPAYKVSEIWLAPNSPGSVEKGDVNRFEGPSRTWAADRWICPQTCPQFGRWYLALGRYGSPAVPPRGSA